MSRSLIKKITGRDDFFVKDSKGGLEAWLNIGDSHDGAIKFWITSGTITKGWNTGNFALAEIKGDGTYLRENYDDIVLMACCKQVETIC